ncbi:MAG: sulfotransferase family 2 domain-containing protein [Verrucomicrobiota bacterium]
MSMLLCPIIPDKKLAFVGIPKNAGTSIRVAFGIAQGFVTPNDEVKQAFKMPWPSVSTKSDINLLRKQGYLRFCVARNPWARLVSCWNNKRFNAKWIANNNANSFCHGMEFLPFARSAHETPDDLIDHHLRSQTTYIFDGDTLLVDRILRFENLNQDWQALRDEFDLPELPHYKPTGSQDAYRAIYQEFPEAKELVAERYARDIEFFGYEY